LSSRATPTRAHARNGKPTTGQIAAEIGLVLLIRATQKIIKSAECTGRNTPSQHGDDGCRHV
jgi:hypothetical protein